jgi:MFS family permease
MRAHVAGFLRAKGFLSVLKNTTFQKLFSGRVITDFGDSLYYIGTMWLVWDLTQNPTYVGIAGTLVNVPRLLTFLYGPLIESVDTRKILVGTQLINGIGVLIVPVVAFFDRLSVWTLLVLIPILQFVNELVYPTQDALLPRIVEEDELPRANSLFSTTLGGVDAGANAIAGVLISVIGAISLFLLNAGTFAVALLLFLSLNLPPQSPADGALEARDETGSSSPNPEEGGDTGSGELVTKEKIQQYTADLREGMKHVRGTVLFPMMIGLMVANVGIMAATTIMPTFAATIDGSIAYGLFMAAIGAGTLFGTATSFLVEDYPLGVVITAGMILSGALWAGAIAVSGLWLTGLLFFLATIALGFFDVLFISAIQAGVEDSLLGRVMSLLRTFSGGLLPVGSLVGGYAAARIGATPVMYAAGGSLVILGLYFGIHPEIRSLPATVNVNENSLKTNTREESIK